VTRIYLCRHGEPEAAGIGRFCGSIDVALSPVGAAQAEALAALDADAVHTSPVRRCVETARPLAAQLGLEPELEPRLREIDFGDFDGLAYAEAAERWPELYGQLLRAPTRVRFPGGENYTELKARAWAALEEIVRRYDGGRVAVFTHAGVIRSLLAHILSVPDEALFRIDQRYGAVNVVDWLDGSPVVRLVNGPPASLAPDG
jgi:alpha-ribazole phosphatase